MILNHFDMIIFWIEISIIVLNFLGIPSIFFDLLNTGKDFDVDSIWLFFLGLYITFFIIYFLFSWGYILFFGFFIFQIFLCGLICLDIYGL